MYYRVVDRLAMAQADVGVCVQWPQCNLQLAACRTLKLISQNWAAAKMKSDRARQHGRIRRDWPIAAGERNAFANKW